MPVWLQIIIILSVLSGVSIAAFAMWLGYKDKQSQISTSMSELQDTVASQQQALESATKRVQNLEAIVTSQVWDAVHDESLPEAEQRQLIAESRIDLPVDEPSDTDRTAQIARRLRS